MAPGVLLQLVTSWHDPVSLAIRVTTRSRVSHAEFLLPDGSTLGAHAVGGVKLRPWRRDPDETVLRFTAPGIDAAYQVALRQAGKPYDFLAIGGILLDRDWRDTRRWFCSELVAWAFERAGAPLLNPDAPAWRITPRDLLLSQQIRRV